MEFFCSGRIAYFLSNFEDQKVKKKVKVAQNEGTYKAIMESGI
jgi:hypothetical protein